MKLALWGDGTQANPGIIADHRILRAQMLAYFKALCIICTIVAFLCMATLALLSYLAAHREHGEVVSTPPTVASGDANTDMR